MSRKPASVMTLAHLSEALDSYRVRGALDTAYSGCGIAGDVIGVFQHIQAFAGPGVPVFFSGPQIARAFMVTTEVAQWAAQEARALDALRVVRPGSPPTATRGPRATHYLVRMPARWISGESMWREHHESGFLALPPSWQHDRRLAQAAEARMRRHIRNSSQPSGGSQGVAAAGLAAPTIMDAFLAMYTSRCLLPPEPDPDGSEVVPARTVDPDRTSLQGDPDPIPHLERDSSTR